jgi:hypothetical protein
LKYEKHKSQRRTKKWEGKARGQTKRPTDNQTINEQNQGKICIRIEQGGNQVWSASIFKLSMVSKQKRIQQGAKLATDDMETGETGQEA